MITEQGTIKIETPLDEKAQKEFMGKLYIASLVCLIIGSVGIAAYMVWSITAIILETYEPSIVILVAFAFLFAFGLIFVISYNKIIKKTRTEDKREVYEFFSNYVVANDYVNGEQVATVKIYYKNIVKRKETKNYIFFYMQANAACPVGKSDMTEAELNAVRSLLGLSTQSVTGMSLPDGEEVKEDKTIEPFPEMRQTKESNTEQ